MITNKKISYIDYDAPEDLLLDLPHEEIDRLYEETFGKSNNENNSDN